MDQYLGLWNVKLTVKTVRVADARNTHKLIILCFVSKISRGDCHGRVAQSYDAFKAAVWHHPIPDEQPV
jgi:hypothetical protein